MRNTLPSLFSRPRCRANACTLMALAALLILGSVAQAQMRPVVLEGGTLLLGDGTVIEHGKLVMQSGKIASVGQKVRAPFLAQKLNLRGKYVSPGLVDAYGTFGLRDDPQAGRVTAHAADALDRYDREEFSAAWSAGVTTFYVPARGAGGIGGLGAVVSPRVGAAADTIVLLEEAALNVCVNAGGPLARVRAVQNLKERFQDAKDYRRTWEDYEEDLKEYEKKIAERAAEDAKKDAAEPDKKSNQAKKNQPGATTQKKDQPDEKKEKKPDDEEEDELKKPDRPEKDDTMEALLRVLDGELRLRIEVHTPADILNIIELAQEYNPALIIEGGIGAHLVADKLAAAHVPIVLTTPPAALRESAGLARYDNAAAPAILEQAGVDVYFGSGQLPIGTEPTIALRAARAIGHGLDVDDLLTLLTSQAAQMLGVDDQVGQLASGKRADVVVWSAHPLVPGARVERVYVGGIEVYKADDIK